MENNESKFCSLWTDHVKIKNCADRISIKSSPEITFLIDYVISHVHDIDLAIEESI